MQTGSYVGNGEYGIDNPTTITFDFEPKIVFVMIENTQEESWYTDVCVMIRGCNAVKSTTGNAVEARWSGNSVSVWHDAYAYRQNNGEGAVYTYLALG